MKSDYIRLEWSQEEYMPLPVGAYIEHEGVKYSLFGQYVPDNNGGVYQYKPEFQHPMMLLAHTPCLLTTRDSVGKEIKQTDWTYTGILSTILGRLQGIIYDQLGIMLTFKTKFKSTTDVEESATCTFSGVDIISAFSEVCNQFGGIEYHIDWEGKTVWFGDIFLGDEVSLEEGGNVGMASKSMNSKDYANYFIVRGGTRNITNKTASGDNVQSDSRLSIDDMDKRASTEQPRVQKILTFDYIYPQLDLYVYNVRKRVRRLKDEDKQYIVKRYNADGTVAEYQTYAVYYMRLAYKEGEAWKDYIINNPSDDIVAGKKLTASFEPNEKGTHSQLAGREYELIYHKSDKTIIANPTIGDSGVNILAGDYEIVFEQDGDLIIPNIDTLQPWGNSTPDDTCDKVVLYNIVMSDEYITNAKVRLAEEAEKEIMRQYTDKTNYTVHSNPIEFAKQNPGLSIGRAVRYRTLSGEVMSTRINRLSTQLDYPIEQEITLGNAVIKGNTQQLREDVKSISVAIDVNESSATRINSMLNSVMRELMEYDAHLLHKDRDDETAYKLTMGELLVNGIAKVISDMSVGGKLSTNGIENDGNNITKGLTELYNAISSHGFKNSMTAGSGWQIDANGNAQMQSIEVRSYMRVLELVMNRLSAEESDFIFTESGTVETATLNEDGTYTLVMRKKTDKDITAFQADDVLKGVVNNLAVSGAVGANYYTSWMQVKEVNQTTNSIKVAVYADNDTPAKKNFPPCNLMVLHRWGNTIDETRQSCWYISSIEKRIVMLDGVTQPKLKESNYASFYGLPFEMENFKGYDLNPDQPYLYVRGAFLQDVCFIDYLGKVVKQERYRGVWSQDVANSKDPYIVTQTSFDTVYHKNAKWQCNSTKGTKEEPSVGTTDWTMLTDGGEAITVDSTDVYYCIFSSGEYAPNDNYDGWTQIVPPPTKEKPYLWTRTRWYFSDGTITPTYTVVRNGKNGANAPRVLYINSDTRPATPTSENPSGWGSIPLRPVAVSNMRAEKTSRADYSFGKVENAVHKEYWASLNKGIYNSIAEALIYFDADNDGTVRFDWYATCGSANKASIYKVNSQVDTVVWNIDGYKTGVYDATVKKGTNFIRVCYEKGEKNTDEDRLFIRVLDTSTSRRIWVVTEILTSDGEYAGWSDPVQWTGNDGRNLTKVTNYYKWGASGDNAPSEPYAPDTIPTHVEGSDYLWNYEVCSDDNDDTISQSGKTCIGYFPKDGDPGKGIKSITEYYQIGTEEKPTNSITVNSNNELDTTGWKTSMDPTTNENRFVWNQEVIQFTDGTYSISVIHLAGAQGNKGEDAKRIYLESELPFIAMASNGIPKDARYCFSVYARLEHLTGTVDWDVVFKSGVTEITDIPYGEEDTYRYNGNEFIIQDSEVIVSMYGVDTIIITATLGNYKAQITIPVIYDGNNGQDGNDGKNGKPLVGPTEWKTGVRYLAGKSNEAYQSLVINPKYPRQMYLCGYTHGGNNDSVEPSSTTSVTSVNSCTKTKPWVQVTYQDFVATKVLFAERGKIENLDITNATIQGTITDMAVKTEAEWDAITNALVPKEEKDYVESNRNFQIVDPSKAGSYFIPTFYPTGRNSNSLIVFLPTYNPSTDYDIITCNTTQSNVKKRYKIPKYQTAGTHIRITKGGAPLEYSRWAYLEDAEYGRLWTSNNGNNRNTIRDIYNLGTLICADHKIFKVTDGNGKHGHNITGAWYYGDSDYKHGRLSVNGTVARMLWLMPGQTVELVSQIEEIDNTKCLVWSVVNASDFTAVNINADLTKRKTYDQNFESLTPIEFHGESGILAPNLAGNVDNWEDCFIAHKKIDNLLLNGETKRIPSLFINRNDPAKDDGYPIAEFYIP